MDYAPNPRKNLKIGTGAEGGWPTVGAAPLNAAEAAVDDGTSIENNPVLDPQVVEQVIGSRLHRQCYDANSVWPNRWKTVLRVKKACPTDSSPVHAVAR